VLWFPWPHLRSGVRQINQLDGIEYVAAGAARELALKTPECRDRQQGLLSDPPELAVEYRRRFRQ